MKLGPKITRIRRWFFNFQITSFRNFKVDEHFQNCVFLKKIWNLSQTGVIITKTWNSKIRITARISSLALIFFVLVDCVLRLRESKLSNSFRIFLGSKWTWFANFERKTPQKLRLLVFMHFIEIRTFFYGFMYFGAKLWVEDPPPLYAIQLPKFCENPWKHQSKSIK